MRDPPSGEERFIWWDVLYDDQGVLFELSVAPLPVNAALPTQFRARSPSPPTPPRARVEQQQTAPLARLRCPRV
jgi:hypothetical protein